ncbi:DMSO/TMAO reductase YedYZ molybdopterin-dependent catalytic subunit [Streptosporangium becharense]|uniref:DMSO/TMAO reductase YedYZ molybdopterin-dependent catalytic subunit n=1 Tax=Streptosporangium becharense TaxID=1816182 RepID=A0A7W9MJL3_9ACTN|nr:sulfite oxidase [Streptosporangium becharense]MBB2911479.1 DMSO/TMAO reductase YedYZ molybdopterin-dependent catalytic subunit [Streptosporangium becharense]MBB5822703.1 DMSO/TMAO reductase YedYZ molybdopterin-dependent catalytic subunit [Streptosporangium becharense]
MSPEGLADPAHRAGSRHAREETPAGRSSPGIVKPLPPELFVVHDTNAEMRWEAMRDAGFHVPAERFFVRNHTATPIVDAASWRLRLHGTGLRNPRSFSYEDLLALPAVTLDAAIECAGNGRSLFTTQQGQRVSGTPWLLGGVGVARWRGVPLATVLDLAGITSDAVDVMARGLDPGYVHDGVDVGPVRRPVPVTKALHDVILAYEMNGRPLPPDHGHPVRLIVPSWIGLASIKWVGDIEVSTSPLSSPWNTVLYRMFGASHPPRGGDPLTSRGVRSAFELAWNATLVAGRPHVLRGRSWSGHGRIVAVEVSTDGGATWRHARLLDPGPAPAWTRWQVTWNPPETGPYALLARATDETGAVQPPRTPHNELGYLFDAVVRHPVTVVHP